jgi:hypothetical protein
LKQTYKQQLKQLKESNEKSLNKIKSEKEHELQQKKDFQKKLVKMQAQHAKDEEAFKEKLKEIAIFETQTKA